MFQLDRTGHHLLSVNWLPLFKTVFLCFNCVTKKLTFYVAYINLWKLYLAGWVWNLTSHLIFFLPLDQIRDGLGRHAVSVVHKKCFNFFLRDFSWFKFCINFRKDPFLYSWSSLQPAWSFTSSHIWEESVRMWKG